MEQPFALAYEKCPPGFDILTARMMSENFSYCVLLNSTGRSKYKPSGPVWMYTEIRCSSECVLSCSKLNIVLQTCCVSKERSNNEKLTDALRLSRGTDNFCQTRVCSNYIYS